jgi:hypothetical protein
MNHTKQLKHTKYQVHQKPIFQDPINTTKLQLLTNSNSSKTDKNHCIIYPHFVFSSIIRPIQIHQQRKNLLFLSSSFCLATSSTNNQPKNQLKNQT